MDDSRFEVSATVQRAGSITLPGFTCFSGSVASEGSSEKRVYFPDRHLFGSVLGGEFDESHEERWNGRIIERNRQRGSGDTILVPRGEEFVSMTRGRFSFRNVRCEIDDAVFVRVLGNAGGFQLQPWAGPQGLMLGLMERLADVAVNPMAYPLVYAESLVAVLSVELHRVYGVVSPTAAFQGAGESRFRTVVEYIETSLDKEIGLFELASMVGMSVTHFSHAFKARFGIAPYRYVLQRRIERAKVLLRTTNDTVATIAVRVGFSSQSSFGATFARATGMTPSAYRDASL